MLIKPKQFEYNTNLVSREQFEQHMILYNNYVKNINSAINETDLNSYNANAVWFHEMFFENIEINSQNNDVLSDNNLFSKSFGRYNRWETEFKELMMKSRGWCILIYDILTESYKNISLQLHNEGLVYGMIPIYVADSYEHSYWGEYGANKSAYVDKLMDCINFSIIEKRMSEL